jgi:hypothetical protein
MRFFAFPLSVVMFFAKLILQQKPFCKQLSPNPPSKFKANPTQAYSLRQSITSSSIIHPPIQSEMFSYLD